MYKADYIQKRQEAIQAVHGLNRFMLPLAASNPQTAWEGEVDTFDLIGHPKAQRCHAFGYVENGQFKSTAVLEIPPVDLPSAAVDIAIAA